jgi:hypothetical protein
MKTSNFKLRTSRKPQATNSNYHSSEQIDVYPVIQEKSLVLRDSDEKQSARHEFDLEERTAKFGETVVRFSKKIPRDPTNNRLIDQLVGAGTSVGANYIEASERVSKKDFRFSISRCVEGGEGIKVLFAHDRRLRTEIGRRSATAL